jgi:hypothetical protein
MPGRFTQLEMRDPYLIAETVWNSLPLSERASHLRIVAGRRSAQGFESVEEVIDRSLTGSEIRLVGDRHGRLPEEFIRILGTHKFRPVTRSGSIGDGRRPRHGEYAFVLNGELKV